MQWIDLFGYEDVPFGRPIGKPGLLEQNSSGIVYLEEITNLKPDIQAALCNFIEYHSIQRYRGASQVSTECRLILGSALVPNVAGRIAGVLPQLYDRIWHDRIELKPLRARHKEMMALAWHYLKNARRFCPSHKVIQFHPAVIDQLTSHSWPGNMIELRSQIYRAAKNCKGKEITISDFIQ